MEGQQNNIMVSISCLTYNHAPYIRQCLDGFIMQQCDFDFEVLIHDDASTDGTADIIKEYQQKYPEIIKPFFQNENQWSKGIRGMNQKFNYPRALGKYLAMCEGDDYWTDPLKLQKQVSFLEKNTDYILVSCKTCEINIKANKTRIIDWHTQSFVFKNILKNDFLNNELNTILNGDTFLLYYLENFGEITSMDFTGGVYRITGDGIWTSLDINEKYSISQKSYNSMLKFFKEHNYKAAYIKVKKTLFDLNLDNYKRERTKSVLEFIDLLWQVIKVHDFKRFKSLLVTLPIVKKIGK